MSPNVIRIISNVCFVSGFVSIAASIYVWSQFTNQGAETAAHGERFGIFVGLWAPTFFILSDRFERYASAARRTM